VNGAAAVGWDDCAGDLAPGKSADLVAIPLDPAGPSDPLENVLTSSTAPRFVYVEGEPVVWPDGDGSSPRASRM
jgi:cytosine/adenosine deaminase-related metal-dependent hydrolase